MDTSKIAEYRNNVITKFISLETLMNIIICNYYMGELDKFFILDILYDENFSFSLRRNILFKILKRRGFFERKEIEPLYRLNVIRNYFSHVNQIMIDISGKARIPDPRNIEESVDFEALHSEYLDKEKPVNKYLHETIKKMKIDDSDITVKKGVPNATENKKSP